MKIIVKLYMYGIVLCWLVLSGCKDQAVEAGAFNNPIQPLSVGFQWVFADSIFDNGSVSTGTTKIVVSQTSVLPSFNQAVYNWQVYENDRLIRTNFVNTDDKGLWHYGEINNNDTLLAKKQWAKFPIEINDTFTEPRYDYDSSAHKFNLSATWTWTCISKNYEIKLLDGTKINCIVFGTNIGVDEEINLLYAENIGYAGWITKIGGLVVFKETLSSHNIK